MTHRRFVVLAVLSLMALCLSVCRTQAQSLYTVTINTTGINGLTGGLAFDLIAGDNVTPNNTVLISGFTTDGTLLGSSNTNQGNATGDLPGTLTLQDSGFSESFRGAVFGNTLSYALSLTTHFADPGAPDEFSFFLTNADNTATLVQTDDPTGADALFILDMDGTGQGALTLFTPSTSGVSYTVLPAQQSVPEPSSLAFVAATLLVSGVLIRVHRRRS